MKQILNLLILITFSVTVFSQESFFKGSINGIEDADLQIMVLPLKLGETPIRDNIQCIGGRFEDKINLNQNMWYMVRINSSAFNDIFGKEKSSKQKLKNREIIFFIYPNDKLEVKAKIENYGINYQVFGNDINIQKNQFAQKLFPFEEELNRFTILLDKINPDDKMFKETESQIKSINSKMDSLCLKMIGSHLDWLYSAETLAGFPEDTIANYFKLLTSDVQNSFFGIHLSKILNAAQIGSTAPDFTLKSENEKTYSLSDFSGKYVVLDFWGTWCGYCIKGIPRMKEYYSKYQDKIQFVSIDCKDNKQAWSKAIKRYDLKWINLIAENEEITEKYGVQGYPTKIIVDKDGKIAYKSTGESDEFYEKLDEIFK